MLYWTEGRGSTAKISVGSLDGKEYRVLALVNNAINVDNSMQLAGGNLYFINQDNTRMVSR